MATAKSVTKRSVKTEVKVGISDSSRELNIECTNTHCTGGLSSRLRKSPAPLSLSIETTHGACQYLNYGYQMKNYFTLPPTTLLRLYVASKQHSHSPASQRQPHPCVRKRINANLSSCAPVKSKLKFSTNQEVIAMRVIPIETSRQLGCKFTT